jgi:uncharacterized protein
MIGLGTLINVIAILIGSAIGVALGHRLSERTRDVVTDGLGLVVLLVAALSAAAITNEALSDVVGSAAVIVVLAAIIIGGVIGSMLRIEDRMEELGMWMRRRFAVGTTAKVSIPDVNTTDTVEQPNQGELAAAQRFVDGLVTASLVFCVGPLAIMGALNDGLGLGIEQLALKSSLDGLASIAFAATLGWGWPYPRWPSLCTKAVGRCWESSSAMCWRRPKLLPSLQLVGYCWWALVCACCG